MSKILLPPVWFLLGGLGMLALHRGLPAALVMPQPWNWLGLVPVAVGLALALSAARLFRRAGTPVAPWETPSALVAAGPYRFSRNPMYLGLALCLSGFAVWLARRKTCGKPPDRQRGIWIHIGVVDVFWPLG